MAWVPLAQRLAGRPHILAGPILRQVTSTSVSVWFVLKSPATVHLDVFISDTAAQPLFSSPATAATQVGAGLYVTVVTARIAAPPLNPGQVYHYEARFVIGGQSLTMAQALGGSSVTYASHARPSFALPPTSRESLRIFHASCRKPRSRGSRDAFMVVGDLIAGSITDADARPHQLFLTGDQIYADTVPDALLMMISDAAVTLIGPENVPLDATNQGPPPGPNLRAALIGGQGKMTSGAKSSHLITFGEYLLMYVFVWSEVLWNGGLPAYADLPAGTVPAKASAAKKHRAEFDADDAALTSFWGLVSFVRKTLANVPTYMIFDDHEVSDDWNLDRDWCDAVYGAPLGMRIVTNAMLAYALCQHWGNVPEQFESGAGLELLGIVASGTVHVSPRTAPILGVHTKAELQLRAAQLLRYSLYHDASSLQYHFQVVSPQHLVAVTDTRTWRTFPRGGDGYPDLIDPFELDPQLPTAAALGARQLFIVLSTNLAPLPPSRWAARAARGTYARLRKKHRVKGRIEGEFAESWLPGRVDFFRFLAVLSRRSFNGGEGSAIVLSGDVHYAFTTRMQYWAAQQVDDQPGAPTQANVVVAQFVASATNNHSGESDGYHKQGYQHRTSDMRGTLEDRVIPDFSDQTEAFFGWHPDRVYALPFPAERRIGGGPLGTWFSDLVPDSPSYADYVPPEWEGASDPPFRVNVTPHYRMLMNHVTAAAGSGLPEPFDSTATDPLESRIAQLNWATMTRIRAVDGSRIVGRPNVAEVNLNGAFAQHFILWRHHDLTLRWMRFDVSLDRQDPLHPVPRYLNEP